MSGEFADKLAEFVAAQEQVYTEVRRELARGHKRTHWIWFIFPQMAGLGFSAMSHRFGIRSRAEARAYLERGHAGDAEKARGLLREALDLAIRCQADGSVQTIRRQLEGLGSSGMG